MVLLKTHKSYLQRHNIPYVILPPRRRTIRFCRKLYHLSFPRLIAAIDDISRGYEPVFYLQAIFGGQVFIFNFPNVSSFYSFVCMPKKVTNDIHRELHKFWTTSFDNSWGADGVLPNYLSAWQVKTYSCPKWVLTKKFAEKHLSSPLNPGNGFLKFYNQ